jgi:acetyltransferase-like isoleucine patch superfamily enzyme
MSSAPAVSPGKPSAGLFGRGIEQLRRGSARNALRLAIPHLRARWQLRKATRVGTARLWGRARVINHGTMNIGDRVRLDGTTVRLEFVTFSNAELTIGEGTYINYGTNISATERVSIGRNCAIGQYSIIMDNDHHSMANLAEMGRALPIVIEDDVWLGARVIVLRGARIGRGSVIGANSVVKGDIPPYSLAAGMPARVIRALR